MICGGIAGSVRPSGSQAFRARLLVAEHSLALQRLKVVSEPPARRERALKVGGESASVCRSPIILCLDLEGSHPEQSIPEAVGDGCDRDDAVGRAIVRSESDDEEIVIVVDQLSRRRKPFAQLLARGAD